MPRLASVFSSLFVALRPLEFIRSILLAGSFLLIRIDCYVFANAETLSATQPQLGYTLMSESMMTRREIIQ